MPSSTRLLQLSSTLLQVSGEGCTPPRHTSRSGLVPCGSCDWLQGPGLGVGPGLASWQQKVLPGVQGATLVPQSMPTSTRLLSTTPSQSSSQPLQVSAWGKTAQAGHWPTQQERSTKG